MSMLNKLGLMFISLILVFTYSINAQDNKEQSPCELLKKGETSTIIYNECAEEEYDKADEELNKLYKELMLKISKSKEDIGFLEHMSVKEFNNKLKSAQLAWVKYRDANCSFANYPRENGRDTTVYWFCMKELTNERIKELKRIFNDFKKLDNLCVEK